MVIEILKLNGDRLIWNWCLWYRLAGNSSNWKFFIAWQKSARNGGFNLPQGPIPRHQASCTCRPSGQFFCGITVLNQPSLTIFICKICCVYIYICILYVWIGGSIRYVFPLLVLSWVVHVHDNGLTASAWKLFSHGPAVVVSWAKGAAIVTLWLRKAKD